MEKSDAKGYINSIQTLGTVDGPGVRFVAFMQGCNLRCGCCHNPETWDFSGGTEYTPDALLEKVLRYQSYFGADGGVTLSGGEPLMQAAFATEFFRLCREKNIGTCLDTSGSILNEDIKKLLLYTDRVLLDIKYTNESMYEEYVGCKIDAPLSFLHYLNENKIPTTLRQVIIPTLNDNEENAKELANIVKNHSCIDKTELLPFKKICIGKYEECGLDFRFKDIPATKSETIKKMYSLINLSM